MIYVLDPATSAVHARSHCEVEGPSFLVTITHTQTGKLDRMAVVRCAYELQRYLDFATDVTILGVQMLCPPSITGRRLWSLEDLVRIVCFRSVASENSTVVYETSRGIYKLGDLDLRRKKTRHVWYSLERLKAHVPRSTHRTANQHEPHFYADIA